MGTELRYSSAYHPQSDGQTERVNQCIESYLRRLSSIEPKKWAQHLSMAEYWYNTSLSRKPPLRLCMATHLLISLSRSIPQALTVKLQSSFKTGTICGNISR